jgi:ferredoxin-NAD(P)+ reductase (naphthalene dioxygenase ferredoxin-specific)
MELRVQPFERRLQVGPGANLLDELRRHEVPVSYSCEDGRCGLCRCEVLEGQVLHQGHDLRDSAACLEGAGHVLACQTVLTEDCTIRLPECGEVVVHPAQSQRAVVTSIEALSVEVKGVRLKPANAFSFSAGQYAMLQFRQGLARPYSMASRPGTSDLEFHIALTPGGRATSHVASALRPGDTVRVSGPFGTAFLRHHDRERILCVAAGAGLAPVLSMLGEALAAGMTNAFHVYFGARSVTELYGADLLSAIAARHDNVQVNVVALAGGGAKARSGLLTDAIAADHRNLSGWRGYFFGAPPAVEAATLLAKRLGMRGDRVHADAFHPCGIQEGA